MNSSHKEKLNFAIRKNAGKLLLEKLKRSIAQDSKLTTAELNFLPLEESDLLQGKLHERFEILRTDRSKLNIISWTMRQEISRVMSKVALQLSGKDVVIFFQNSDKVGALRLSDQVFFRNAIFLLDIDGDSIYGCYDNFSNGVVLDKSYEDGTWLYEVMVWGETWKPLFEKVQ